MMFLPMKAADNINTERQRFNFYLLFIVADCRDGYYFFVMKIENKWKMKKSSVSEVRKRV